VIDVAPTVAGSYAPALGARVAQAYASGGVRNLWFSALGRVVYRRLLVLERRLDEHATAPPEREAGAGVRVVELDDAHAYRRLRPEQPLGEFVRRRAAGALCFAALDGDRVVGATWAQRGGGWCAYLEREIRLADDEVYLFDTLVDPRHRGARIAPAIALAQVGALRRRGVVRLVATVLPENRASLRARARSGFRLCGRIGWVGVGPLRRPFFLRRAARPIED